ncbi:MAG TPA: glycosyltransferase family 4 protein [Planctomycetaceae bacterium]|nr:glycosyltransferase family 4 protein [Planctomycetaceae bacterium]
MDEPLKVLLVAGPFEVRGWAACTLRLAEGLSAERVKARILTPSADRIAPSRRKKLNVLVSRRLATPVWGNVVRESIARELARDLPDLIHIQSWSAYPAGLAIARRLKRPFVLTAHDHGSIERESGVDWRWGRRIIAVSQSVRAELLSRAHFRPERVTVVHPGVDVPASANVPAVLSPDRVPVIGTAGPLEPAKGQVFFLGAAQRVVAERPDTEFLIAGSGPEEQNLRRLARELGLASNVTFISSGYDFASALAAMDLFCLPSLRQGLGTIMLEAMALGRPVIASGVGGVPSVIRNAQIGLVVPPSDSARLAERMLELLNDPVRARAIGETGRRLVGAEFTASRMVAETARLYREVLAGELARPHAVAT